MVAVSTRRSVGAWSRVATKVIEAIATARTESITSGDGKATPRSSRRRATVRPEVGPELTLGKEAMGKVTNREREGRDVGGGVGGGVRSRTRGGAPSAA